MPYFGIVFLLYQMTPLHLAVETNHIKMVECLLDQGADLDLQDDDKVILHTNVVDYILLAVPIVHFLCCLNIRFSFFKLQS